MVPSELEILVGVYENEIEAKHAIDKLQTAGFTDQQIGMIMRKGVLMPSSIMDDLVTIGVSEEEARLYEREFQAGRVIVVVRHEGRIEEAFKSLYSITITNMSVNRAPSQEVSLAAPEESSLWKLLKDAGLDYLL